MVRHVIKFIRGAIVASGGVAISSTTIPTSSDASELVHVGDVILINQVELRTVVAVTSSAITVDRGIQHPLAGAEIILVKQAIFSTYEDTTPLVQVNALGTTLQSTDATTDAIGTHTSVHIQHFSSANAAATVRVPGTVSVTRGSDVVFTSTDLTGVLTVNQYIRIAGATYVVHPTKSFDATSFHIDRVYAGPSYNGVPLYIEGLGASIDLRASGADLAEHATGAVEAVFVGPTSAKTVALRLATADSTQSTTPTARLQVAATGVTLLGGANTIATEFDGLTVRAASFVNVAAGTDELSKQGGAIVLQTGDSTSSIQQLSGGALQLRTGISAHSDSSSGAVSVASGQNSAHSGSVELRSGTAGLNSGSVVIGTGGSTAAANVGGVTVKTGVATTGNGGDVAISTADLTTGAKAGDVSVSGGKSTLAQAGGVTIAGGDGNVGGNVQLSAGATSLGTSIGGKVAVAGGNSAGTGGDVAVSAGNALAAGVGGKVTFSSGTSATGASGDVTASSADAPTTGNVVVTSGAAAAGASGSVSILAGAATGGVSGGITVSIKTSNTGTGGEIKLRGGNSVVGGPISLFSGTSTAGASAAHPLQAYLALCRLVLVTQLEATLVPSLSPQVLQLVALEVLLLVPSEVGFLVLVAP
ncbi:hypothetical protein DYB30_010214 [Aphanomyces astaci]|uniref:Uncharacterized protein n=2 Tax=Aphanomyces astaci TaxID=112090 RepID=A0A397E4P6_APHAT|nr:hypothetical protein DYB36_000237 [Aphanomyces astaci]RHY40876.1 hypothetical protein DYB34_011206 [Aphanomyces astaci]RHY75583.1 hypothetical protein DYB30_010214 [Aphanomyces astaci]